MDERHLMHYLMEIIRQAQFAQDAIRAINDGLAMREGTKERIEGVDPGDVIFRNMHSLLTHAANVSKLLFPGGDEHGPARRRGRELRAALGVPDDHVLGHRSRVLRNQLDHFDEVIDRWSALSTRHNYIQDTIAPWGSFGGLEDHDVMRWYDPPAKTYRMLGEPTNVEELFAAVVQVGYAAARLRDTRADSAPVNGPGSDTSSDEATE